MKKNKESENTNLNSVPFEHINDYNEYNEAQRIENTSSFIDEHQNTKNELKGQLSKELEIENIKSKCKFKQDLVDNDIILSVNHLKQYFFFGKGPNRQKQKAVHNVSFQVKSGECFGIVGESGCGKTTTGRSIIHLYNITSGSIYYKGYRIGAGSRWNEKEIKYTKIRLKQKLKDLAVDLKNSVITKEEYDAKVNEAKKFASDIIAVQKAKIKQIKYDNTHVDSRLMNEIQMIFQDPIDSLDPRMTVEDIIQEGLTISRRTVLKDAKLKYQYAVEHATTEQEKIEAKIAYDNVVSSYNKQGFHKKVVEALEKVGLIADYANRYPHEFSGGQRQRIGIARALVMNPKLLICDEPISALDVSIRAQIINLLNELKEEMNLTIIFIAHDLSVVKYFCDRIAVMYFGELVELASSDELFKHPLHPYTKSLLSAIPRPNPLTEKNRVRIVYNPRECHDYSKEKPRFVEVCKDHFVLANSIEVEKYKKEIEEIDKKNKDNSK